MSQQRNRTLFEESIKSKYTAKNYRSHLKQFVDFMKMDNPDKLLSYPITDLQYKLEDYLFELKQTTNPNTIPSKFQGIRHFCIMNDITLNWIKLQKMFPRKQKTQTLRAYTTKEIQQMLKAENSPRNKALIHFLASTGARVGIFDHKLSIKHMKKMSSGCIAVLLYAGEIEEYHSFLTPQAAKSLAAYHNLRKKKGEEFTDNTPIFRVDSKNHTQLGLSGARSVIWRAVVEKSRINRQMQTNRYDVQINHGFRKRFNTILKLDNRVNYNIAEKLMGHKNGLDGVYFTPTLEELFAEYRKIIGKLEI